MDPNKPHVVCFVSGKGGVGKTMLATAFARELSLSTHTLLVDFDFFNRGLTGLMPAGRQIAQVPRPSFLNGAGNTGSQWEWDIVEIDENLHYLSYPDLTQNEMRSFATAPIDELVNSFETFLDHVVQVSGCQSIVIDCHGGPDNSSFAAAAISDHTLIVTEPDRITLHGTLNFVRQMDKHCSARGINLHVVFNKVVKQFSGIFLKRFYDRVIKEEMGGAELVAIVPMELYLTKEFEKTSFLTDAYPYSVMASKVRLIINSLFTDDEAEHSGSKAGRLKSLLRYFQITSTGRQLWFADKEVITPLVATLFAVGAVLAGLSRRTYEPEALVPLRKWIMNEGEWPAAFLGVWFGVVLFLSWNLTIDRITTYHARLKNTRKFLMYSGALLALWSFPIFFTALIIKEFPSMGSERYEMLLSVTPLLILVASTILVQLHRIHRLIHVAEWRELWLRIFFLAFVPISIFVFYSTEFFM